MKPLSILFFVFSFFSIGFSQTYELHLRVQKPVDGQYVLVDTVITSDSPVNLKAQLDAMGITLTDEQLAGAQKSLFLEKKSVDIPKPEVPVPEGVATGVNYQKIMNPAAEHPNSVQTDSTAAAQKIHELKAQKGNPEQWDESDVDAILKSVKHE